MPLPIVLFDNVDLSYGLTLILKNISLQINPGEHCVILGANGSGKSTLIRLMDCELYPSYKQEPFRREIFGQERWVISELRKHFGIVTNDLHTRFSFEGGQLSGFETVLSGFYGTLGQFSHQSFDAKQKESALAAMERVGISHLKEKRLSEMSTGELRKCIVARALVHPVKAVLLDEPTVGLDIKSQLDFIEMMRTLANTGTTVILVTHHIEEVFEEIQKVVLIKEGEIYAQGPKEELLSGKNLSEVFNIGIDVIHHQGRYSLRASAAKQE